MSHYDMFEADKEWWKKIIVKIPDDEIWAWIEELHGLDITEKVIYDDVTDHGKVYGFIDDTLICRVITDFDSAPHWLMVRVIRYWLGEGWELPKE